jgi:hypothetical protein
MKAINWIIAAATFACAEPVQAGLNDPEVIIYRFPGVSDNGGGTNLGVATVFHCTNFSGVDEILRFLTRYSSGALASNVAVTIQHLRTRSASTHLVAAYFFETNLATGPVGPGELDVGQGTTAIAATSINIICTAETIDASTTVPIGLARRGIRFNPVPGSQE